MFSTEEARKGSVVLIVDDDETTRVLASQAFLRNGLESLEAANGREAIEIFERQHVDLILLDVEMPECDGFEVVRTVRAHPEGRDLPIIMMTGHDDLAEIARAYELGATDFVTKPVNWLILCQRTNYVLRASQSFGDLRRSQERLHEAQSIAHLGTWELGSDPRQLECSDEFARIFGQPRNDNGAVSLRRVFARIALDDRARVANAFSSAFEKRRGFDLDFRIDSGDEDHRMISCHASISTTPRSSSIRLLGTAQDITERILAQERIHFLAYHDNLTGVGNQLMFRERLAAAVDQARRHDRSMALLFIDLDKFKRINDTLGHAAGDAVLQAAAERLKSTVRMSDAVGRTSGSEDSASVARLGGDEFTILLSEIRDAHDAARVGRRILDKLREPVEFEGRELAISASIGIAVAMDDGQEVEPLLRNADAAMYHAKELGGDNFQFYRSSMNADSVKRLKIEGDLSRALERNQIQAHYQPRVDVSAGRIVGAEALARWHDPEIGMISPGVFIPVAEESDLILSLGEMMLKSALEQARAWHTSGFARFLISVNLSARQLSARDIVARTLQIVEESGIDPVLVELEITEGALIQNEEAAERTLRSFKDAGLRIALDDFGTGYSSMSFLKRFPVDTVKIDRSFINGIGSSDEDEVIVEAILSMTRALRLSAVAEGVETADQKQFLEERCCDEFQGYLISPAVPPAEFEAYLREGCREASIEKEETER